MHFTNLITAASYLFSLYGRFMAEKDFLPLHFIFFFSSLSPRERSFHRFRQETNGYLV